MEASGRNEYKKSSRSYHLTNKEEYMIDPVTGGSFAREKAMYMNYHGFTEDEADLVMAAQSYKDRDKVFSDIVQKRWDIKKENEFKGYLRLIAAVASQAEKEGCNCENCRKWIQLRKDWC